MFGYVRPLKGELKVREYESFKSVYCGLCHELKKRCGFAARFVANYDLTFMAMLLSEQTKPCYMHKRCIASPFRKKCCCCSDPALEVAADYSVILAYWKLRDSVEDDGSIKARLASLLLRRGYKKAAASAPEFDSLVRENLRTLAALEAESCDSIDRTADSFAAILRAAAEGAGSEERRRILAQIFYHVGRVVYILDAVDDLERDVRDGSYNPLIYRFNTDSDKLSDEAAEQLKTTLYHSQGLLASAFELLPATPWTGVLTNIIYDGLPWVTGRVFAGSWGKKEDKL